MTHSIIKVSKFLFFISNIIYLLGCERGINSPTAIADGNDPLITNDSIVHYFAIDSVALAGSIMITKTPLWSKGKVVFSIAIPELKKGDIIVAKGETQGTSLENYNIAFTGFIVLTNSASKLPDSSPAYAITEDNGFNITPDTHQGMMTKFGTYVCQSDFTNMYINFSCRAYSSGAQPNDSLTIEQNGGRLAVIVYRNQL